MDDRRRTVKIVVSIVALALAGYLGRSFWSDGSPLPSRFHFVCVETGKIFNLSVEEAGMIPATNHKTGRRTLIPCVPDEDGGYRNDENGRASCRESV